MTGRHEFAVVGAGLVGLAVTRELARRGRDVICLEQATIGHERSGSKGNSRLFRYGYDDPFYVELAMRSLPGWLELSEESGQRLLEPTGLLWFGGRLDELESAMTEGGAPCERLGAEEIAERFGGFEAPGRAVYEPTAAVLRADEILQALARSARGHGAEIAEGAAVMDLAVRDAGVHLELNTASLECEVVVLCGGAWSGPLAGAAGLPDAGLFRPSLQQVAYLEPGRDPGPPAPAFVERGAVTYYGLPSLGRYKIGLHNPGGTVDPAQVPLDDDVAALGLLRAAAERLLPGFDPVPVATECCFYDNTANEDFVMDRVGRVVLGAGSSGHGFKFGPIWGEALADLAAGVTPAVRIERFSLRRHGSRVA